MIAVVAAAVAVVAALLGSPGLAPATGRPEAAHAAGDFPDFQTPRSVLSPPAGTPPAPRALWVARNTLSSRAEVERAVADCARIRCSLLFLQVSGRWDAWFPSDVFPPGQALDQNEDDNLARAIELAHRRGIRVHAWVNSLLAWSAPDVPRDPSHVFHSHPEWFLVGQDGRSMVQYSRRELDRLRVEGYFLEPRIPEVRTQLRRLVIELATRYDLDGVHLDYIRLASAEWGFSPRLRKRYRAEAGLDPLDLYASSDALARERGPGWLASARAAWQAWHRDGVTQLVRLIAADLREVRPGIELSAAVLANPRSARDDFGQDWVAWLDDGVLDLAVPMAYRSSAKQVLALLQELDRVADPRARLYAGVSLEHLPASEVPAVEALMGRYGADGVALFSYDLLRGNRRAMDRLARE